MAEHDQSLKPLARWLWWALLVSVPVTSFPLVQRTFGGETVSPLSLIPLIGLVAAWLLPYLLNGERLSGEVGPLLLFAALALGSSLLALFLNIEPYKGQTSLSRAVRGVSILGIGIGFYLCAALIAVDRHKLRGSLWALYAGLLVTLLWSAAQAWYILFTRGYIPPALNEVHRLFSTRDLFWDRVTGLAFEPSWFGNQLAVLYLPLLLGSVLAGRSAFGSKWLHLLLEIGLAAICIVMLALARSRLSLISIMFMGLAAAAYGAWKVVGWMLQSVNRGASAGTRSVVRVGITVLVLGAVGVALGLVAVRAIERDPRSARILSVPDQVQSFQAEYPYEWIYAAANRGAFAERLMYWSAGLWPFELYPLTGVGLGNAGFFFREGVPAYGHQLVEIRAVLDAANPNFPNPKSLWVRLLAETGAVGFAGFAVWLVVLGVGGVWLVRYGSGLDLAIGWAGLLALLAQVVEGFSLDTFALPQFWLMMGMLTATIWRVRGERWA